MEHPDPAIDLQEAMRREPERRARQTDLIISQFEQSGKHLDAADAALDLNLPIEMKAYDCIEKVLAATQCLHATVRHILEALQFERGPNAAGYLTFPGLPEYLESHPATPPKQEQLPHEPGL